MNLLIKFAFLIEAFALVSCSGSSSKPTPGTDNPNNYGNSGCGSNQNTGQFGTGDGNYGSNSGTSTSTGGFPLAGETYYGQVKAIIDGKCATSGCHDAAGAASSSATSYEDYAGVSSEKTLIASLAEDTLSHSTTVTLSETQKQAILGWRDAGYPQGQDTSDGFGTGGAFGDANASAGYDPCNPGPGGGTGDVVGDPTGGNVDTGMLAVERLINSDVHKECLAKGIVTYRKMKGCVEPPHHEKIARIDESWCGSIESIKQVFKDRASADVALQNLIDSQLQGYEPEQCGNREGDNYPVVTWIKKNPAEESLDFFLTVGKPSGSN